MKMKFGVLKIDDVKKYCSEESKQALDKIVLEITTGRMEEGKKPDNTYYVINSDEPYSEEVVEILKRNGHWD